MPACYTFPKDKSCGGAMLEICTASFLLISAAVSILLWRALMVAKRADDRLKRTEDLFLLQPAEERSPLRNPVPSGDD